MKNKKAYRFLLPAVLGIWAVLGWKLYEMLGTDDSTAPPPAPFITPETVHTLPDSYQLLLDYPDPFLAQPKKTSVKTYTTSPVTSDKKIEATNTTPERLWPTLHYHGLVKSPKDGKTVGFLTVDGVSHFITKGETVAEITVTAVWRDSVQVVWNKEDKVVRK